MLTVIIIVKSYSLLPRKCFCLVGIDKTEAKRVIGKVKKAITVKVLEVSPILEFKRELLVSLNSWRVSLRCNHSERAF
jgi:hypothetical protein